MRTYMITWCARVVGCDMSHWKVLSTGVCIVRIDATNTQIYIYWRNACVMCPIYPFVYMRCYLNSTLQRIKVLCFIYGAKVVERSSSITSPRHQRAHCDKLRVASGIKADRLECFYMVDKGVYRVRIWRGSYWVGIRMWVRNGVV